MAIRKTTKPAARMAAPAKRRTSAAAKRTAPTRRRRTVKKRGLGEIMTRTEAQAGFNQLIGLTAGYFGAQILGKFINPEGEKDKMEIGAKLVTGFLVSTTGKMPSVGAGIMASGVSKLYEANANLGDNGFLNGILPGKKANYLNQGVIMPTGLKVTDLADYSAAYQSKMY
jgi:hypothetical protein